MPISTLSGISKAPASASISILMVSGITGRAVTPFSFTETCRPRVWCWRKTSSSRSIFRWATNSISGVNKITLPMRGCAGTDCRNTFASGSIISLGWNAVAATARWFTPGLLLRHSIISWRVFKEAALSRSSVLRLGVLRCNSPRISWRLIESIPKSASMFTERSSISKG